MYIRENKKSSKGTKKSMKSGVIRKESSVPDITYREGEDGVKDDDEDGNVMTRTREESLGGRITDGRPVDIGGDIVPDRV